ncbi:MAG: F0F1 ATP synthase subunit epsilon [Jatrophihabitans sp.]|nr:MAG: F0F1 ATP synthase subunit epsilon [Jatrophihabitans sp.]
MNVELVSVERQVWSGQAKALFGRTPEGELGILPGHINLLGALTPGWPVRIEREDAPDLKIAVDGAFLSVRKDGVSVLAEQAEFAADVDVEQARADLHAAESDSGEHAAAARAWAMARLRAAGESV